MNKTTRGRTATTISVSVTPEQLKDLNDRLEQFSPLITGPSQYFRLLMRLDEKKGLIRSAIANMEGDANPFLEGFAC